MINLVTLRNYQFCRFATMRVANSRYNAAVEFGNSAERKEQATKGRAQKFGRTWIIHLLMNF